MSTSSDDEAPLAAAARHVRRLASHDAKHALRLTDGRELLGWIDDVGDGVVRCMPAPSPMDGGDEPLYLERRLDQIDLASLAYHDPARGWVELGPPTPSR